MLEDSVVFSHDETTQSRSDHDGNESTTKPDNHTATQTVQETHHREGSARLSGRGTPGLGAISRSFVAAGPWTPAGSEQEPAGFAAWASPPFPVAVAAAADVVAGAVVVAAAAAADAAVAAVAASTAVAVVVAVVGIVAEGCPSSRLSSNLLLVCS